MPEFQDITGRVIQTQNSIQEMKALLTTLLQGKTSTPVPYETKKEGKPEAKDRLTELVKMMENIESKTQETLDSAKKFFESMMGKKTESKAPRESTNTFANPEEALKNINNSKKEDVTLDEKITKSLDETRDYGKTTSEKLEDLAGAFLKKGSGYTHDIHVVKAVQDLKESVDNVYKKILGTPGESSLGSPTGVREQDQGGGGTGIHFGEQKQQSGFLSRALTTISAMVGGFALFNHLLDGIIKKDLEFAEDMRKVAFQTQGINAELPGMQKQFQKIGDVVAQTGQGLNVFQDAYLKNLKKGIRSQKETISITKTALNLATMIGSDVGETNDTFAKWNVQLNMSDHQIAEVSRGIQDVAKNSGVTGDNLLRAVKNAEPLIKTMRNMSTLTAEGAKNIIAMQASAEKFDVADQFQEIFKAMGDTNELFMKSSDESKRFLFIMAQQTGTMKQLTSGQLLNDKGAMKQFGAGISDLFKRFGVNEDDVANQKLNSEQMRRLNMQLQAVTGKTAYELIQFDKAIKEGAMSFSEQIDSVTASLQDVNSSEEEKLQLNQKLNNLYKTEAFGRLTEFSKARDMNKGASIEDIASKLNFDPKLLEKTETQNGTGTDKLRGSMKLLADQIKAAGGTDLTKDIESAFSKGKAGDIKDVIGKLNDGQQKISAKDATKSAGPLADMAFEIAKINEGIRQTTSPLIGSLLSIVGSTGLMVAYLASMAASAWMAGGGNPFGGLLGSLKLFEKGKAGSVAKTIVPKAGKVAGGLADMTAGAAEKISPAAIKHDTKILGGVLGNKGIFSSIKDKAIAAGKKAKDFLFTGSKALFGSKTAEVAEKAADSGVVGSITESAAPEIPDLSKLSGSVSNGASQLIRMVPSILMLGAAVLGIAFIFKKYPELMKIDYVGIAKSVGGLLLAAGAIAGGITLAYRGLKALDEFIPKTEPVFKTMWGGAKTLVKLTPAILGLSAAIITLSYLTNKLLTQVVGLDIVKTAAQIGELILASSAIAGAILLASKGLELLGGLSRESKLISTNMLKGAIAILVLTPAITLLAGAVIGLSSWVLNLMGIDPEKASKTASAIADLFWSTTKILGAMALMTGLTLALGAGVSALLGNPELAAAAAVMMLMGAAAILILTPAMIALSAAIIKLADSTMKFLGINPEETTKAAEAVGNLLWSATKISGSIVLMAGSLAILGAMAIAAPIMVPLMFLGAKALEYMTPAIIELSKSIIDIAKTAAFGMTAEEAKTVSDNVGTILWSAGKIIGAILIGAAVLTGLGASALGIGLLAVPLMFIGGYLLKKMVDPIIGLAADIINISKASMEAKKVTPEDAAKTAASITSLIESTSKIIEGVNKVSAMMPSGAEYLWDKATDWIVSSSDILGKMAGTIKEYVSGILVIAAELPKKETLDAPIAKMQAALGIFAPMSGIMEAISKTEANLPSVPWAWWKSIKDTFISSSSDMLLSMTSTIKEYVSKILSVADELPKKEILTPSVDKMQSSLSLFTSIAGIMDAIKKTEGNLPSVPWSWWKSIKDKFVSSSSDMLDSMGRTINVYIDKIQSIAGRLPDKKELDPSINKMKAIIPLFNSLSSVIDSVNQVKAIITKPQPELNPADAVNNIAGTMGFVTSIGNAIANSLANFDAGIINKSKEQLAGIATTLASAKSLMDTVFNSIKDMTAVDSDQKKSQIKKIYDATKEFKTYFGEIGDFIRIGIVDSMKKNFSDAGLIIDVEKNVKNIVVLLDSVGVAMNAMSEHIMPLTVGHGFWNTSPIEAMADSTGKFQKYFSTIITFFKEGIIDPINFKLPGLKTMEQIVDKIGNLIKITTLLPESLSKITDLAKTIEGMRISAPDKIASKMNDIGAFITSGIINPIKNWADLKEIESTIQIISAVNKMLATLEEALTNLGKITDDINNKKPNAISLPDANFNPTKTLPEPASLAAFGDNASKSMDSLATTGKLGGLSIPAAIRGETSDVVPSVAKVNPTSLTDVGEKIAQQKVPTESNSNTSKDMAKIAAAEAEQVDLLNQLHMDLSEVIKLLKPSPSRSGGNSSMTEASNRNKVVPSGPADYGRWQFGKNSSSPGRNAVQTGI